MQQLRLSDPALNCWIDVRLPKFGGRWLAVADCAGAPELGLGDSPSKALRGALAPFGPRLQVELVAQAELLTRT